MRDPALKFICLHFLFSCINLRASAQSPRTVERPNVVIIYADDLGYGDLSCYGADKINTPAIDAIAARGLRFTNAYATSATCTPSRFSLLTGQYAWRKEGTGIATGDAGLILDTAKTSLAGIFRSAGYRTGAIGKWHLGLGPESGPDWNGTIKPGPLELGFDYCFLMPATADRVPCVFLENHRVVNLDPADPISVSYGAPLGNWPTGKNRPDLLKFKADPQHSQTIVNGISRIGFMEGGRSALWNDENMAETFVSKAREYIAEESAIAKNKRKPFFLYFAPHDIHVPHSPNPSFAGKSELGARGDAILQLDWTVGQINHILDSLGLSENTILMISSDNGPVVTDGYANDTYAMLNGHRPAGNLSGGKYSALEAGTRIPFIAYWPGKIKAGISANLVSQVDLPASFAALTGATIPAGSAPDSWNTIDAFLESTANGREYIIQQSAQNVLSIVQGRWKYIEPASNVKEFPGKNIETGYRPYPQLFDLTEDPSERRNLANSNPKTVEKLEGILRSVVDSKSQK